MYKDKKIIALVPARGGSKRVPHKNIKPLSGKPLVAWTVEQAKKSKYVDRIIVSTDDEKIRRVSQAWGAECPFLRPGELATDEAKSIDVVLHAIEWLEAGGVSCDLVLLLQPTSPLRTSGDIDGAVEFLFAREAEAVVSVYKDEEGGSYRLNGAIYLAYTDFLRKERSLHSAKALNYIMPKRRSVDIDNDTDFRLTEFLIAEGD